MIPKIYLDGTEKSMIPILKRNANKIFPSKKEVISLEEFSCGTGISDLTIFTIDKKILSTRLKDERKPITSRNQLQIFLSLFENRYLSLSEIEKKVCLNKNTIQYFLKQLVKDGLVEESNKKFKAIKKGKFKTSKNIIAIEAKVKNWKSGIRQAMRYKEYADYSYLAIYEKHISSCLKHLEVFNMLGIGLIGVGDDKMKIYLKARLSNIVTDENKTLASERFLSIIDERYESFVAWNGFSPNYAT